MLTHHDLLQNGTTQLATSSCYCTCSGPHRMLASYQMKKRITQQIPIVVCFSRDTQLQHAIHPATLRTLLRQCEKQRFHHHVVFDTHHTGVRFDICGTKRSNFRDRASLPRSLQTLYSRWRIGQVESCGTYARKLKFVESPQCRFCGFPTETTIHLLTDCPDTASIRANNGISLDTLRYDTRGNILAIACFDAFIRNTLPYDKEPPNKQLLYSSILTVRVQLKRKAPLTSSSAVKPEPKRQRNDRKESLLYLSTLNQVKFPERKQQLTFKSKVVCSNVDI